MEVYDQEHGNGIRICSAVAKTYCELTFLSRKAISKISKSRLYRLVGLVEYS
jgi:hypothetical protein